MHGRCHDKRSFRRNCSDEKWNKRSQCPRASLPSKGGWEPGKNSFNFCSENSLRLIRKGLQSSTTNSKDVVEKGGGKSSPGGDRKIVYDVVENENEKHARRNFNEGVGVQYSMVNWYVSQWPARRRIVLVGGGGRWWRGGAVGAAALLPTGSPAHAIPPPRQRLFFFYQFTIEYWTPTPFSLNRWLPFVHHVIDTLRFPTSAMISTTFFNDIFFEFVVELP